MDFQTGDVVRLRSGGGKMTVHSPFVTDDDRVRLCHFGHDKITYSLLPPEMLERVPSALDAALDLLRETADRGISEDWEVRRDELLAECDG
ncbi:MAG: DUF2158 domain-containing protein [Planctomycetota bacterium]|jgi:hypothetical protein